MLEHATFDMRFLPTIILILFFVKDGTACHGAPQPPRRPNGTNNSNPGDDKEDVIGKEFDALQSRIKDAEKLKKLLSRQQLAKELMISPVEKLQLFLDYAAKNGKVEFESIVKAVDKTEAGLKEDLRNINEKIKEDKEEKLKDQLTRNALEKELGTKLMFEDIVTYAKEKPEDNKAFLLILDQVDMTEGASGR